MAFGFRHHVEVFEEMGHSVRRVFASDGGAASRVWMQIAADVLGQPVQLLAGHPGSCLGAAYVAASATARSTAGTRSRASYARPATIEPDPARRRPLYAHYALYRETYERLQPLYPRLAASQA